MYKNAVAVVGIGCRFPGRVGNPNEFWEFLENGGNGICEVPKDRWDIDRHYSPDNRKAGNIYVKRGGFLADRGIDTMDPQFFGISPREAAFIDPQQRLLMEVSWEALEDAGIVPSQIAGSRTGVFVGVFNHDYEILHQSTTEHRNMGPHSMTGFAASICANRISYLFDLRGPSMAIDTACSSSLVAVHLGCKSILHGESEVVIAGGVNVMIRPEVSMGLCSGSMLSPDGYSKSFDARADGYARGEGAGVVVLKELNQALSDGDSIYSIIRGTATNQDGRTDGITVPNNSSQRAVITEALSNTGIARENIGYVEAHGTGTPVGDPIEANALSASFCGNRSENDPCIIGSVKSNFGHLEAASGVAGLIKASLMLRNKKIPPNLHFQNPNPNIPFKKLKIKVPTELIDWCSSNNEPLRCAVNSFGFGGSNAHAVLEEAPRPTPIVLSEVLTTKQLLIPISARTIEAVDESVKNIRTYVANKSADLYDVGYTLAFKREHHLVRSFICCKNTQDVSAFIDNNPQKDQLNSIALTTTHEHSPKLGFVYSGMGPQWWGMGRGLFSEEPVYRETILELSEIFQKFTSDWVLIDELTADETESNVQETFLAQPAIFSTQVALTKLLNTKGVYADSIVGHSVGEVAGFWAAGVLSLTDAALLCFHRSRLQHSTAGRGRMLAVGLPYPDAEYLAKESKGAISIAAVNSSTNITLSGDSSRLQQIQDKLDRKNIFAKFLDVDVPYHSPVMDSILKELSASLSEIRPQKAQIPVVSTVTGSFVDGSEIGPTYWCKNVREPVDFSGAVKSMCENSTNMFLEISSHPVLKRAMEETVSDVQKKAHISFCQKRREDDSQTFFSAIGSLYSAGYEIDWRKIYPEKGNFVPLPTYPWQFEQCWNESDISKAHRIEVKKSRHPFVGRNTGSSASVKELKIDIARLPYLKGHKVQGAVVFPAAAFVEICLAEEFPSVGGSPVEISEFDILAPLLLNQDFPTLLQLSHAQNGKTGIYSSVDSRWVQHVTFSSRAVASSPEPQVKDLGELESLCPYKIDIDSYYATLKTSGLDYGSSFTSLIRLKKGDQCAFGVVSLPKEIVNKSDEYLLHPVILDGAFQVIGSFVKDTSMLLPARIDHLRFFKPVPDLVLVHCKLQHNSKRRVVCDFSIFDETGSCCAEITGFHCQRVFGSEKDRASSIDKMIHQYKWITANDNFLATKTSVSTVTPHIDDQNKFWEDVAPAFDQFALGLIQDTIAKHSISHTDLLPDPVGSAFESVRDHQTLSLNELLTAKPSKCVEANLILQGAHFLSSTLPSQGSQKRSAATKMPALMVDDLALTALHARIIAQTIASLTTNEFQIVNILEAGPAAGCISKLLQREYDNFQFTVVSEEEVEINIQNNEPEGHSAIEVVKEITSHKKYDIVVITGPIESLTANIAEALKPGGVCIVTAVQKAPRLWVELTKLAVEKHNFTPMNQVQDTFAKFGFVDLKQIGTPDVPISVVSSTKPIVERQVKEKRKPDFENYLVISDYESTELTSLLNGNVFVANKTDNFTGTLKKLPDNSNIQVLFAPMMQSMTKDCSNIDVCCVDLMHKLQEVESLITETGQRVTFSIVTKAVHAIINDEPQSILHSALWGLGRTAISEGLNFQIRLIDTSFSQSREEILLLAKEVSFLNKEDEIALRGNRRFLHRFKQIPFPAVGKSENLTYSVLNNYTKNFDGVAIHQIDHKNPGFGEILVQVEATAFNFKDILKHKGLLPENLFATTELNEGLGSEFSGVVIKVGDGVSEFSYGDEVLGFSEDSFSNHIVTKTEYVVKKPQRISHQEAATITSAFVTAYHSLINLSNLKKGESVLIHSASGAVGLAAIQMAKNIGVTLFVTAGNPQKQSFLKAMGCHLVSDSRSERFTQEVLEATNGQGIDVILNTISADFMRANLSILKPNTGIFIDIANLYNESTLRLEFLNRGVSYHAFDIERILKTSTGFLAGTLKNIKEMFEDNHLYPLPFREYDFQDVKKAFAFMSSREYIGKIVLSLSSTRPRPIPQSEKLSLSDDGTYLLTGGLGGFGLATANWLVKNGARNLVLTGRSGLSSDEARVGVKAIENAGANVIVASVDVTNRNDLEELFKSISVKMPPLKGVVHCAMVLRDEAFQRMTAQQMVEVLKPKVQGAWNLHQLTEKIELDFFVLYSSISSHIGNVGQANYAAANSFLDSLAEFRVNKNLPATSFCWGPIDQVGVLARSDNMQKAITRMGTESITLTQAWKAFVFSVEQGISNPGVIRQDWKKLSLISSSVLNSPKFEAVRTISTTSDSESSADWTDLPEEQEERITYLKNIVADETADVFGIAKSSFDSSKPLDGMGLDSLMAVELSVRIKNVTGVDIPQMLLMQSGISVTSIVVEVDAIMNELSLTTVLNKSSNANPGTNEKREPNPNPTDAKQNTAKNKDPAKNNFQSLVVFGEPSSHPPIAIVLAGYGDIWAASELSKHLERQIYALQPPTERNEYTNASELSKLYINEIKKNQPVGPYHLAGYSAGAILALDIANQLNAEGETVAFLGLFDPNIVRFGQLEHKVHSTVGKVVNKCTPFFERFSLRSLKVLQAAYQDKGLNRHLEVLYDFKPAKFDGTITIFQARLSFFRPFKIVDRWQASSTGKIIVHRVPGDHDSFIRDPHVKQFAQLLEQSLKELS